MKAFHGLPLQLWWTIPFSMNPAGCGCDSMIWLLGQSIILSRQTGRMPAVTRNAVRLMAPGLEPPTHIGMLFGEVWGKSKGLKKPQRLLWYLGRLLDQSSFIMSMHSFVREPRLRMEIPRASNSSVMAPTPTPKVTPRRVSGLRWRRI
ncbi:MAG: hypothetical protein Ct9H300mP11_14300 [Chloroflexota bacterium]|nr:MAG: hypothetical protein Ct9H300mP11_14300 [Chloroflexota bacterium]